MEISMNTHLEKLKKHLLCGPVIPLCKYPKKMETRD